MHHVTMGEVLCAFRRKTDSVPTESGAELVFDIVSDRYERGSIALTTNLPSRNGSL